MSKRVYFTAICLSVMVAATVDAAEVVVAPTGMTPQAALEQIRAAKADGSREAWRVVVKPGIYPLRETLTFTPDDSGTPEAPVTWVGEVGAVFSGGDVIQGWVVEADGTWSAPLPTAPDGQAAYFEQLWVNGRRAERARLPNDGQGGASYFKITQPTITAETNTSGKVTYIERVTLTNALAAVLGEVPPDELPYTQMCVVHKWSTARRILRKVDPATLTVETWSPRNWSGWVNWSERETLVCFENVRGAFDAPGEWFYDVKASRVRYRPLEGESVATAIVIAPNAKLSQLVAFKGQPDKGEFVHDIVFRNLTFAYSDATAIAQGVVNAPTESWQLQAAHQSDGAVTAEGVRHLTWDGCTVAHTGNYAFRFNNGCVSNKITNCTLEDLGAGGVWMGATGGYVAQGEALTRRVIRTLAPRSTAFNVIDNCTIRQGGRFDHEGTGVALTHVSDTKVTRCTIHDFYYTGISVGWTWGFQGSVAQRNEIAFNTIYDLGKGIMSDMGGVYTLGTSFGTTVHNNVIHDVQAYSYGGWALYTDEGSEGIVMERNLCWNTTDGGFHQHYGAGCVIRNNIFAWNQKVGAVRTKRQIVQGVPCTLHFVNNIVVVREGPLVSDGPRSVGGIWAGNLWYDYSGKPLLDGLTWSEWQACGKEIGGRYADPLFENPENNDFRLKPESPAFGLGFKAWDYKLVK